MLIIICLLFIYTYMVGQNTLNQFWVLSAMCIVHTKRVVFFFFCTIEKAYTVWLFEYAEIYECSNYLKILNITLSLLLVVCNSNYRIGVTSCSFSSFFFFCRHNDNDYIEVKNVLADYYVCNRDIIYL